MITVRECTLEAFSTSTARLVEAVRVHAEVSRKGWAGSYHFFKRAEDVEGFRGLIARIEGNVVGTGFGYRAGARSGDWWYEKVAEQLGEDHPVLRDAWQLVTLDIRDAYRDLSVATMLHDALLQAQAYTFAIHSVQVDNYRGRKFYEQMGWQYAHPNLILRSGEPHHVVMYKKAH